MGTSLVTTGGGLSNSDLLEVTATVDDVLTGKTFFAGDKNIKTGVMEKGKTIQKFYSGNGSRTLSLTGVAGYASLTKNNIIVAITSVGATSNRYTQSYDDGWLLRYYGRFEGVSMSYSYTASTGSLAISISAGRAACMLGKDASTVWFYGYNPTVNYDVYIIS